MNFYFRTIPSIMSGKQRNSSHKPDAQKKRKRDNDR